MKLVLDIEKKIFDLRNKESDELKDAFDKTKLFGIEKYSNSKQVLLKKKQEDLKESEKTRKWIANGGGSGTLDPAIMGGLSAGITGSNVVGVATAYQTEQKNMTAKNQQVAGLMVMSSAIDHKTEEIDKLATELYNFEHDHSDCYIDNSYISEITFDNWKCTLRESGNLTVTGIATLRNDISLLQHDGVIDGSIKISCFVNNKVIAEGYYSAPGFNCFDLSKAGFGSSKGDTISISALCVFKEEIKDIDIDEVSIVVTPIYMWVIKNKGTKNKNKTKKSSTETDEPVQSLKSSRQKSNRYFVKLSNSVKTLHTKNCPVYKNSNSKESFTGFSSIKEVAEFEKENSIMIHRCQRCMYNKK